ncbi:glycosyltransferase [Rossellomorea sp. KS-H15a]|uniref:glycosyltransferase family 2 protein n=1 Tax=Rossellomorea sp. KS-H15a TaxID=2963940 RepID=UPI0020C64CD0|nr:glycosyltransferase [Rossellomorea sp. KS-H15a]UTE75466.1 glycosyltransferase [Rossellomorea sp. KS-H15a]
MKVSIIIPFYNCPYIDQAIKSALNQTYKNIEVIVVDDGSTEHVNKIAPFKGRIKYIRKQNGGTASALNLGLRHASGKYFAWLSSDDMYLKDKVERQLGFMEGKGAKISYTAFKTINENNMVINEVHSRAMSLNNFRRTLLKGCPVNGCTVMAEVDLIKRIGWFNEKIKYAQDYEMWCRVSLKTNMYYLGESLVLYRVHSGMGSLNHSIDMVSEADKIKKKYRGLFRLMG